MLHNFKVYFFIYFKDNIFKSNFLFLIPYYLLQDCNNMAILCFHLKKWASIVKPQKLQSQTYLSILKHMLSSIIKDVTIPWLSMTQTQKCQYLGIISKLTNNQGMTVKCMGINHVSKEHFIKVIVKYYSNQHKGSFLFNF